MHENLKTDFSKAYKEYREKFEQLENLLKNKEDFIKMQEMYKIQFNEIASYNIDLEKDNQLEEKIKFLSSIEKVKEAVSLSMDALSDGEISATLLIEKSIKAVNNISNISSDALKAEEYLNTALTNITEATAYITGLLSEEDQENLNDDLNNLIDRKYKLQDLAKRYGGSLESV